MEMWRSLHISLLVIAGFLGSCMAEVIKCTVTSTPEGTLYTVPGYTGTECHYSWTNNGTVIANTDEKLEQVMTSSNRTLETLQCHEEIIFTCDCLSGTVLNASCTTNCSDNAGRQNGGTPANHLIAPFVVIFLVLIGVCCYFAYKRGVCSKGGRVNQPNYQAGGNVV